MKRCPKCNRTFPDENQKFCTVDGGLLIAAAPAFDPNATIRATSADVSAPPEEPPSDRATTSRDLVDPGATIASYSNAPTVAFPRNTGPTTGPTTASHLPAARAAQPQSSTVVAPAPATAPVKSKLPWIIGGLLLLLFLGASGLAAVFFVVIKPRLDHLDPHSVTEHPATVPESNRNMTVNVNAAASPSPELKKEPEAAFVPPPGAEKFTSTKDNLDPKLAEHFIDFSFYYPQSWQTDPKAGVAGSSNFAKVQKTTEDDTGEYLLESTTVRWYPSKGTFESDLPAFPDHAKSFSSQLAASPSLPGYEKVSEGPTQVNTLKGYEFRFKGMFKNTGKGDLPYWGRAIFLPPGVEGEKNGALIVMLATSLAPDLTGVQDVGEKGDMPLILESFRFGRPKRL